LYKAGGNTIGTNYELNGLGASKPIKYRLSRHPSGGRDLAIWRGQKPDRQAWQKEPSLG
jgi:hypothetical protein